MPKTDLQGYEKDMKMYQGAGNSLKFPFLAFGSNQYLDMPWNWDS